MSKYRHINYKDYMILFIHIICALATKGKKKSWTKIIVEPTQPQLKAKSKSIPTKLG